MSRTYRKPPRSNPRFCWWGKYLDEWVNMGPVGYTLNGFSSQLQRDGKSYREWTGEVKKATRRERRRDWKKSEHIILRSEDFEEVDVPRLEKKYLGEIWKWD